MAAAKARKIIALAGGKGGVGKSTIAANLAIALAELVPGVVLADLDLGMANQHTLFGIDKPGPTLHGFFSGEIDTLEAALQPTVRKNLSLLPGSGAHLGAANITPAQKQRLIHQLRALDTDILVVDVGAGMNFTALDFFLLGDVRLVVLTPQLTSLENAYAFLKVALYHAFRNASQDPKTRELFDAEQNGRELDAVHKLVQKLSAKDPTYGATVERIRTNFGLGLIGNLHQSSRDANSVHAMRRMIKHFLALDGRVLGTFQSSSRLHESVSKRRPVMLERVSDNTMASFRAMAAALHEIDVSALRAESINLDAGDDARPVEGPHANYGPLPATLAQYERQQPRVPVTLPVQISVGGESQSATIRELSLNGALLATPMPLAVNARVEIIAQESGIRAAATVRNQRPNGGGFGIEFDSPQEALYKRFASAE